MPGFTLRPYQQAAVHAGLHALRAPTGTGLLIEPVGAGKSLILANIVRQLDAPALIFQPTKEILEQNAAKLLSYGYEPAIYSASMGEKRVGQITLATIGSVRTAPHLFETVRYVLVDEADLVAPKQGMYKDFLAALGSRVRTLGVTATPFRLVTDGYGGSQMKFLTRTRPRVFDRVSHVTQIADLVRQGFLAPLVYHRVPGFNRARLVSNTTGADYTDESVQRHFDEILFRDKLQRVVERLVARGKRSILVFTRFVEDAEILVQWAEGVGIRAAVISGETPKAQRAGLLDDFKAGAVQVVANVGVLTAGFDFPALDTVVLARPSKSLRLYMQMVGRVVRPAPGKTEGWVVDMVGLTEDFGEIADLRVQSGGATGEKWEFVTVGGRPVTNTYLD